MLGWPGTRPRAEVFSSDGTSLHAKIHDAFIGGRCIRSKCVDLASAYKQLAVSPVDVAVSVIAVWNPGIKVSLCMMCVVILYPSSIKRYSLCIYYTPM